MIKLFGAKTFALGKKPVLPFAFLPHQYFSEMKPDEQGNDPNKDQNKTKKKIRFGFKHPAQTLMQNRINERFRKYLLQKQKQELMKKQKGYKAKQKQQMNPFQKPLSSFFSESKKNTNNQQKNQNNNQSNVNNFKMSLTIMIILFLFQLGDSNPNEKRDETKNIQHILSQIEKSTEKSNILIQRNGPSQISLRCKIGNSQRYVLNLDENELVYLLEKLQNVKGGSTEVQFASNFTPKPQSSLSFVLKYAFIFGGMYLAYILFKKMRGAKGGAADLLSPKKFTAVKPEDIKIHFSDVAGMHQAKFEITEFVQFLKRPQKYIQMGAKVPKGALLTGPPGTGKTLLAKACAGEAGVPFFSVSGSDFVEKYSGLGASRVRNLFDEAEKNAPSIIFIDEIDAIGKKRDGGPFSNEERDNTLNQLLVRMDGFDTTNKVIVMAATNRKDMLDPALLRPGRFDRSVEIGLPNLEQRAEILKVHLKKVKYDPSLTEDELSSKIARLTPGFSGAELANTCNEAAILSARQNIQYVTLEKFEKATERVMAGLQKRNMFTAEEKEMLAFYEAGKAVTNWFTEGADPVIKISILPFSKSKSGYSHSIKDQTSLNTKQELLAKVCCYLAGRSAEQHFKGYVTTNGNKDLERAKKIITMIVTKFGMSQKLKMLAFPDFDFTRKPYSQKTQALIDIQIANLTKQCQERADKIIKDKQQEILKLKQLLLQKQTLKHTDIKKILGDRPFGGSQNYREFLKDQEENLEVREGGPAAGAATG